MHNNVSQTSSPIEVSLTGYTTYAKEKVLPAIEFLFVMKERFSGFTWTQGQLATSYRERR